MYEQSVCMNLSVLGIKMPDENKIITGSIKHETG